MQVRIPQESLVPVPDHLLGELYRSSPDKLESLIEGVPAQTRAMLALYCHGRAHLQSIALAVAASCEAKHLEVPADRPASHSSRNPGPRHRPCKHLTMRNARR